MELPINKIVRGDVLKVLPQWPAKSIHMVVTSPPYYGLRSYGIPETDWPEINYRPMAGCPEFIVPKMTRCLGLENEPHQFIGHMVHIFRQIHRVLRDDGTLWVNMGDCHIAHIGGKQGKTGQRVGRRHTQESIRGQDRSDLGVQAPHRRPVKFLKNKDLVGIPWRLAFALQADGWYLRMDNIWHKRNCMPLSVRDRCTTAHEMVFLLSKKPRYFYDFLAIEEPCSPNTHPRGKGVNPKAMENEWRNRQNSSFSGSISKGVVLTRNKRSVWDIPTRSYRGAHFATFPESLVQVAIRAGTSEDGVCISCGSPRKRVVKTVHHGERVVPTGWDTGPGSHSGLEGRYRNADTRMGGSNLAKNTAAARATGAPHDSPFVQKVHSHWESTCECAAASGGKAVVFDPFMGSGTTAAVAKSLGRDFVGVELNPKYIKLAKGRLEKA